MICDLQLVTKQSGRGRQTITAKVRVPKVNEASVSRARVMGGGAIVMSMLGAKTPATSLPKGAIFDDVTRNILVASEAVWKLECSSPTSFA